MKNLLFSITLIFSGIAAYAQPSDAYVLDLMTQASLPGANAVIIKDGHWIYNGNWGKANIAKNIDVSRQTVFMMASISKTMIATSLMQLWEQGKFQLNDDVNKFLPFKLVNPFRPNDTVTFKMLMTHTSAIKDNYDVLDASYVHGDSPESLDSFLRNYFVEGGSHYNQYKNFYGYPTGKGYNYSNVGSTLAAYLVQRITGDDYAHYCDTAIFAKLCMDHTALKLANPVLWDTTLIARPYRSSGSAYYDQGLYGYPDYPDGQLRTNITSLARFMTMYMQHGIYEGTRILQSSTVDMMMQNHVTGTGGPGTISQGLFFYAHVAGNGDTLWGHNGGDAGVSTCMYFSYKTNTGAIVFTNGNSSSSVSMETIHDTLYKYGITVTPTANDTFPKCEYATYTSIANTASALQELKVYPNPAHDVLHIELPEHNGKTTLHLTDIVGHSVYTNTLNGGHDEINTSQLPSGMYVLSLVQNEAVVQYKKILVTH